MIAVAFLLSAAAASIVAPTAPDNDDNWKLSTVAKIEGQYLPLITKALAHPRMRGRRLDCYEVSVNRWTREWRVYFAGYRAPKPPDTETEIYVGRMPQNSQCPDIGFIFDARGRVSKVYGSRE